MLKYIFPTITMLAHNLSPFYHKIELLYRTQYFLIKKLELFSKAG